MITEEVATLSEIISTWGWHLLAWMCLLNSFVFLPLKRYEFFMGLVGVFFICEIVAINKKKGLQDEN